MAGDESDDGKLRMPIPAHFAAELRMGAQPKHPGPAPQKETEPVPQGEFAGWISPAKALNRLGRHEERKTIIPAFLNRLRLGLILSAAELTVAHLEDGSVEARDALLPVPPDIWTSDNAGVDHKFWRTSDTWLSEGDGAWTTFTGVRFDPSGIETFAAALGRDGDTVVPARAPHPPPPPSPPSPAPEGRRVGRPKKDYWEELLVEMMRRIWIGDLKPRRQADVRHAMAEWIVEKGCDEPKPTALKERAKLVFDAYENQGE